MFLLSIKNALISSLKLSFCVENKMILKIKEANLSLSEREEIT